MYEHATSKYALHAWSKICMDGLARLVCRTAELDDNFAFHTHAAQ
jgi:hypothetical protein